MDNRQMLELAAKAAGYDVEIEYYGPDRHGLKRNGDAPAIWNPLEDDGDAFRLMVNLNLSVRCFGTGPVVDGCYISHGPERITTDLAAAVRLAIVKAAAEIGKRVEG